MVKQHLLLGLFWVIFCVLHSLLANSAFKNRVRKWMGSKYYMYRILYTVFAFVTLVLVIYYGLTIPTSLVFDSSLVTEIIGMLVGSAGLILMLICIKKYFISLSGLK